MSSNTDKIYDEHKARMDAIFAEHQQRVDLIYDGARREMQSSFRKLYAKIVLGTGVVIFLGCLASAYLVG
jgi:hypothetical protein